GTYEGTFDAREPGNYVAMLNWRGTRADQSGYLLSGMVVNTSPELRDLRSNAAALERVRAATGGRLLPAFDAAAANLFTRQGLRPSVSPQPVWDRLVYLALALILIDVAIRRIAWDWQAVQRTFRRFLEFVKSFTTTRKVESSQAIDALKKIRESQMQDVSGTTGTQVPQATGPLQPPSAAAEQTARPDPTRKFDAGPGVEGEITELVGGATQQPASPVGGPPQRPQGGASDREDSLASLLAAKKRARQQMDNRPDDPSEGKNQ
ncbi:MAG: hypothetical protein RMJ35_04835, partial [Phycisphaerales bacterium]|nr:hypothetical protein [Phycisphaerales bacterium]